MANAVFMLPLGEEDADIRKWLAELPRGTRAAAVREAIRTSIGIEDPLLRTLREVREMRKEVTELAGLARKLGKTAKK